MFGVVSHEPHLPRMLHNVYQIKRRYIEYPHLYLHFTHFETFSRCTIYTCKLYLANRSQWRGSPVAGGGKRTRRIEPDCQNGCARTVTRIHVDSEIKQRYTFEQIAGVDLLDHRESYSGCLQCWTRPTLSDFLGLDVSAIRRLLSQRRKTYIPAKCSNRNSRIACRGHRKRADDFWRHSPLACFRVQPADGRSHVLGSAVQREKKETTDGPSAHLRRRRHQIPHPETQVPLSHVFECLQSQEQSLLSLEIRVRPDAAVQLSLLPLPHQARVECARARAQEAPGQPGVRYRRVQGPLMPRRFNARRARSRDSPPFAPPRVYRKAVESASGGLFNGLP